MQQQRCASACLQKGAVAASLPIFACFPIQTNLPPPRTCVFDGSDSSFCNRCIRPQSLEPISVEETKPTRQIIKEQFVHMKNKSV